MSSKKSSYSKGDNILLSKGCSNSDRCNFMTETSNENRLFLYYMNIALSLFEWSNLPEGLDSRILETYLVTNGQVFAYKDNTYGLMILPCNSTNNLNPYGQPISYVVTGVGFTKQLSADDGVRCIANPEILPLVYHINYYVDLIDEIQKTHRMNIAQQRMPYILVTSKKTEFSMKQLQKKIKNGEHSVLVDQDMYAGSLNPNNGTSNLVCIPTVAPYIADKLQQQLYQAENELLTLMGLNNSNIAKEGGVSYSESLANNEIINVNLASMLFYRQKFCDEVNAKFGTNISVEPSKIKIQNMFIDTAAEMQYQSSMYDDKPNENPNE